MSMEIKAAAFDIDGTLYPNSGFYLKVWFYYIRHLRFFLRFNKIRKMLRESGNLVKSDDFFEKQARLFAETYNMSYEKAYSQIKEIVYDGLKPYYLAVKPFADVHEAFQTLKDKGIRLAVLSDFPVEQKGDIWGLAPLCDVLFGSENIGVLKPSKVCFESLCQALKCAPEEVLYVGNSFEYDVLGAKNAGLKTAWITKKVAEKQKNVADIVFSTYRQFIQYVIE